MILDGEGIYVYGYGFGRDLREAFAVRVVFVDVFYYGGRYCSRVVVR